MTILSSQRRPEQTVDTRNNPDKFRMHMDEIAEYTAQLLASGDAELVEAASASLWDCLYDSRLMIEDRRRREAANSLPTKAQREALARFAAANRYDDDAPGEMEF